MALSCFPCTCHVFCIFSDANFNHSDANVDADQLRAQISAIFLLISNLVAVGIGTTLVALISDKVFENPLMVGTSLSIVGTISCILAFILLKKAVRHLVTVCKGNMLHDLVMFDDQPAPIL